MFTLYRLTYSRGLNPTLSPHIFIVWMQNKWAWPYIHDVGRMLGQKYQFEVLSTLGRRINNIMQTWFHVNVGSTHIVSTRSAPWLSHIYILICAQYAEISNYKNRATRLTKWHAGSGLNPTFNVKWAQPGVIGSNLNAI